MEILRVAANTDGVSLKPFTKIMGASLVAGIDAATALIFDAATQTGTAVLSLKALANDMSQPLAFDGGVPVRTGISVTLTGTSPILYIFIE